MSYAIASNQTGDASETIATLDIIGHGWICCMPSSRDAAYDRVIDFGAGVFETVQIKTLRDHRFRTSNRSASQHANESVSKNGKLRERWWYKDRGIHWIAAVDPSTWAVHWYHINTYRDYDEIDIRRVKEDTLPRNFSVKKYQVRKQQGDAEASLYDIERTVDTDD